MSNLNSIVDVQISMQNSVVQATQFDLILVLGIHKVFPELFREYTSASDMLTDGFLATSPEYYAAVAIFSQTPTVNRIYVGRRASNYSIVSVDSAVDNTDYFIKVNGNIYNYTSKAAPTTNAIVAGLVAACGTDAVANATNNLNGTYDLRSKISSVPYTLLLDANQAWESSIVQNDIINAIDNTDYTTIIDGTSYTYHATATSKAIATGLATALETDSVADVEDNLDGTYELRSANPNNYFSLTLDANQTWQAAKALLIIATVVDNTDYVVQINSNSYTHNSGIGATAEGIAAGLVAAAAGDPTANFTDNLDGTYSVTAKILDIFFTLGFSAEQGHKIEHAKMTIATVSGSFAYFAEIETVNHTYTYSVSPKNIAAGLVAAGAADPTVHFFDNFDGTYAVEAKISGVFFNLGTDNNQAHKYNLVRIGIDNVVANFNYYTEIENIPHIYNSGDATTRASVAAGLCAAGAADPIVTFIDNLDGTYIVDNKVDGTVFTLFTDSRQSFASGPSQSIDVDLTAIQTVDNSWYGFLETTHEAAIQAVAATWSEANEKLFGLMSNDPKIINEAPSIDTTSIAAVLKGMNYHRSFCIYEQTADLYGIDSDSAWMGLEFAKQPGQSTWAWKTLTGIEADTLTSTQIANCKGKRCNCYHTIAGVDVTDYGTVFDNKYVYIDIVRGIDWLKNTIQTSLWGVLTSMDKIPYTDAGINILAGYLRKTLMAAVANGILSDNPAPIVTAPKAVDVPIVDKQDRILRNLNFTAILAGAIQKVQIRGTVSF
jgi:hypothetical protein